MITFFSLFSVSHLFCNLLASNSPSPTVASQTRTLQILPPQSLSFCVFMMGLSGLILGQPLLEFSLPLYVFQLAVEGRKLAVLFTISGISGKTSLVLTTTQAERKCYELQAFIIGYYDSSTRGGCRDSSVVMRWLLYHESQRLYPSNNITSDGLQMPVSPALQLSCASSGL